MKKFQVLEFLDNGYSPFGIWFSKINAQAAAKVSVALYRLEQGNTSNVKPIGPGVSEYKIDFGPGYRIYFGQDGDKLIILLSGGTKKTQSRDIERAKKYWAQYKTDKKK